MILLTQHFPLLPLTFRYKQQRSSRLYDKSIRQITTSFSSSPLLPLLPAFSRLACPTHTPTHTMLMMMIVMPHTITFVRLLLLLLSSYTMQQQTLTRPLQNKLKTKFTSSLILSSTSLISFTGYLILSSPLFTRSSPCFNHPLASVSSLGQLSLFHASQNSSHNSSHLGQSSVPTYP